MTAEKKVEMMAGKLVILTADSMVVAKVDMMASRWVDLMAETKAVNLDNRSVEATAGPLDIEMVVPKALLRVGTSAVLMENPLVASTVDKKARN